MLNFEKTNSIHFESTKKMDINNVKDQSIPSLKIPGTKFSCEISDPLNKTLKVREIAFEEREDLSKVINVWKTFARSKEPQIEGKLNVFQDSLEICECIDNVLKNDPCRFRIFVSFQSKNDIEAIGVTSEKNPSFLYLDYLITHPKNIRSPLNENELNKVHGAASKVMSHLAEVAKNENKDEIRLYTLPSAIGFYEKLGFKNNNLNMTLSLQNTQ